MIKAGRKEILTVGRISDYGLYLTDGEDEVLLPNRYVSLEDKEGDQKEVFIYHDSEDRLVATTETPYAMVGETAYMRVVDKTMHGAFLDWGLFGKDLFLPNRNQQGGVIIDKFAVVYLYEDSVTGRCVATTKLKSFVNNDDVSVKGGSEVEIMVASESQIGYRVVVNNRHWGMIYKNQIFQPIALGDRLIAHVKRVTEDNRIDIMLRRSGYGEVKDSAELLLDMINEHGGELPINDSSTPEQVARTVQMSKKLFKRSLGILLKRGVVVQSDKGVKIVENE